MDKNDIATGGIAFFIELLLLGIHYILCNKIYYYFSFTMLHKSLHFLQGSSVLHVEILDINDNPPEFVPSPSASLSTYIRLTDEGPDSVNRVIIDVNATDKDDGTNAKIVYSLSGDQHRYFQLDSSTVRLRTFL